jgi:hypothetical protein
MTFEIAPLHRSAVSMNASHRAMNRETAPLNRPSLSMKPSRGATN